MGMSNESVDDLLQGRLTITLSTARRLSAFLGASVEFWMARDFQYRQDSRRIHAEGQDWLRRLPLGDMVRFGWLQRPPAPSEELSKCLEFFAVNSVDEWRTNYAQVIGMAAFRTSPSYDSRPESVVAWLRQGEIEAEGVACESWSRERFRKTLFGLRELTRVKDPRRFLPKLRDACARCGVALVVVRAPTGCRASGATRTLGSDRAVLQLSFRFLTDDQFWFTFFHEAAHLVLHTESREVLILEGVNGDRSQQDAEANRFAGRMLIPDEYQDDLHSMPTNWRAVVRFASRIGVSPGIVVGQLQHLGRIDYSQLNRLKRRFEWSE